jgi:hypothetical protein
LRNRHVVGVEAPATCLVQPHRPHDLAAAHQRILGSV